MSTFAQRLKGHAGWMASLFLTGLGAKLGLIFAYGSPFPYADQWPATAINLFIPYLSNQYTPALLFRAHNEHRIVFTRLCELLLLVANGQWDCQLEMLVNAVIHCGTLAGLGWLLASMLGKKYWPFLWLMLVACLALPVAWENTLWGFQSQFYFLLFFSLLAIWGLGLGEPKSGLWLVGAISAVAALFAMATGFFAAVVVIGLKALELATGRQKIRRELPTLVFCGVMVVAGICLKTKVPEHGQFQAHSAGEFLTALAKNLAWPWPLHPWYALFNMLPLAMLGWKYLRSRDEIQPIEKLVLAIGMWAGLQSVAAAFARGAGGATPAWRYMDLLSFLMVANALSILILLSRYRASLDFPRIWQATFILWALGCAYGLWFLSEKAWKTYLPDIAQEQKMQLQLSREFITTNDPHVFDGKPSIQLLVLNLDAEVWLLSHPLLRAILPTCAREPLPVVPLTNGAFARGGCLLAEPDPPGEICWGSYSKSGAGGQGNFESQPIKPAVLPYLEIPVAGNLGAAGTSLELVDVATGASTIVKPLQPPGERWESVRVRAPAGEFKIVAANDNPAEWFAFKEPRAMGRLSFWTARVLAAWKWILSGGLALLVVNLFCQMRNDKSLALEPTKA